MASIHLSTSNIPDSIDLTLILKGICENGSLLFKESNKFLLLLVFSNQQIDEIVFIIHIAFEGKRTVIETSSHFRLLLGLKATLLSAYFIIIDEILACENLLWVDRVHNLFVLEKSADDLKLHYVMSKLK